MTRKDLAAPPGIQNPYMLIQSPTVPSDSKELNNLRSAGCGKTRQNPQPPRNPNQGAE